MSQIGRPQREILVEPLTIPVPTRVPSPAPIETPTPVPVQVPA